MRAQSTVSAPDREMTIARRFDAPPARVFAAWLDLNQLSRWWGPDGYTTTTIASDIRQGGFWRFTMHGPDGTDYPTLIEWREVTPPSRLVYDVGTGEADDPGRFTSTVEFAPDGAGTRVTMRVRIEQEAAFAAALEFGAAELGCQTFERLAALLDESEDEMTDAPTSEVVITHVFNAAQAAVWRALTECDALSQWLTPGEGTMPFCQNDLRPGGRLHYQQTFGQGVTLWGVWDYLEVAPPDRLVILTRFSDAEAGTTRNPFNPTWPLRTQTVTTLAEAGGRTTVTMQVTPYDATPEEIATFASQGDSLRAGFAGSFAGLERLLAQRA